MEANYYLLITVKFVKVELQAYMCVCVCVFIYETLLFQEIIYCDVAVNIVINISVTVNRTAIFTCLQFTICNLLSVCCMSHINQQPQSETTYY